jgi:hypothetical protein
MKSLLLLTTMCCISLTIVAYGNPTTTSDQQKETVTADSTIIALSFCTSIKEKTCDGKAAMFSNLDDVWLFVESNKELGATTLDVVLTQLNVMTWEPEKTFNLTVSVEDDGKAKVAYMQLKNLDNTSYTVVVKLPDGTELSNGKFNVFGEGY